MKIKKLNLERKWLNKKVFLVSIVLCAITFGCLHFAGLVSLPFLPDNQKVSVNDSPAGTINYNPPTEKEKEEADKFKDSIINKNETTDKVNPDAEKISVIPVVSSWGQNKQNNNVEISGYVPGIFEDNGTCTAVLEKSGQKVSKSNIGQKDAKSVTCGLIVVPRADLSPGNWSLRLDYSSSKASGVSNQKLTLEVL